MMPESSGGVSDGAEDRVDVFVLSSVMSRVVGSVPHAWLGSREFSLGVAVMAVPSGERTGASGVSDALF